MPFYFIIIIDSLYVQAAAVPEAADREKMRMSINRWLVKIYMCVLLGRNEEQSLLHFLSYMEGERAAKCIHMNYWRVGQVAASVEVRTHASLANTEE